MQIRAGHFVTPAAQGNGLGLALGQSLIDANAYCVKYPTAIQWQATGLPSRLGLTQTRWDS
jgi:hypothetical protein